MYTKEILSGARDKLEDWKGYGQGRELWKDLELLRYLNNAHNDWAKETLCLRDSSTEAICKILLLSNQHTYPMDSRIKMIHKGRLLSGYPAIDTKDEAWLNENIYSWETRTGDPRYVVPDYEIGKLRIVRYFNAEGEYTGAMTFAAVDKSITKVGANFNTYLAAGSQVVVSGTTLNNGTKTVVSATVNVLTISETVTNEAAAAAIVRKVRDTMWLSTSRLPLTALTLSGWETESPEINSDHHPKLIYGILREAYEKDGSQTLDPQSATKYRGLFQAEIEKAKGDKFRLRHSTRILRPHPGTL